jgi:chromosome segregation ATPase
MQGKFAQLAYAAAIAQGKATIASGRAEMMAATTGAIVAVGLAGIGTKLALDGQKMRHADINNNLVKSNNLQNALGDAQETLAKRPERIDRSLAPNRNMKSGDTVNARPGAQPGVEAPELNPTNSTELQRGQARVDSAHQEVETSRTQVKQSEVQLKDAEAKLNAEQYQLEAANTKVQSLEQQVATADSSQKVTLQTDLEQANADLGKVTEKHSQTQADVKALQSQLSQHKLEQAKAEVGLAEADVELSTANVQVAQRNVQTASSQLEAANSNALVKDQAVDEMEAKLRTAPESDRARLNDDLVLAKNERTAAHRQKQVAETDLSSAKAELSAANAQLAQASLNLKSAETTLSSAQRSAEGLQAEDTQRRDLDERERANLSYDIRQTQGQINKLQLNSRLRQKDIDKLLTYSQLLLASSSVMSSMVLASIRTQSFIEQSNAILRGSEAATQNSLTRTEEQTVTEDSAEINKLLDAVKQLQQQNADVVSHVASMRS